MINTHDKQIVRSLAAQVAEVAALPVQEEKRQMWRRLNGLRPVRPMAMIDQVCWNEMNVDDELTLRCEDPECRGYEDYLRKTLYQWRHFPVDMVVEPFVRVQKAVHNTGLGIGAVEEIARIDPTSAVVGHSYKNQFLTDSDLDKIKMAEVTHDEAETDRRMTVAHDLFDGELEIFGQGLDPYLSVWDPISTLMSVQDALYALIDRPDYMKELARRIVASYMVMLDQAEQQGLLCHSQSLIHCTGAYTDDLPAPGFDPAKPHTQDMWMFGLAQMFSTVSPSMFEEYEVETSLPIFERFGLVYYGCCDPLDLKMDQVRKIPNLRKISMSPWVDERRGAEQIGGDYVYSRKPNPALLVSFNEDDVRSHLQASVSICKEYACPLEIILKDISTVCYDPTRLWRFAEIVMEAAEA